MFRFLVPLAVLCCCLADKGYGTDLPITIVRVGIENTYKNGLWTPITVEYPQPIETLAIRSSDSDGTPITYRYEIDGRRQTADGSRESTTVLAKLGRKDEPIHVSVNGGEFKSFPVPPPVNAERPIYHIFGNDDIGLQGAVAELMLREDRRPLLVKVNSFADLPTEWFGYEAVEMVVLTTTEPALFEGTDGQALSANSPQIQALNDWLKLGGKMLLCAGKDSEQFLENEDGFLHLFLPGKYDGMTELRISTPLERFVNSQRQIFMNGTEEAPFMKMPRILEPRGITFVRDGDLPLVLRCAHGLGTIIYFGGDLSGRPLGNWRDRTTLVRNIMQWNRTQERGTLAPRSGAMLQLGYNDISGQIRSALDQYGSGKGFYSSRNVIPFSIILIILAAYWLVIGLFDWFFVHKVLKKPILTWITFPLWIVLFSFLMFYLTITGLPYVTHNYFTLIDVDQETGVHLQNTWHSRYAPHDERYDSIGSDSSADAIVHCSWYGLPGSGLGGMAPRTITPSIWQVGSEQASYSELMNVPVQTRSSKSFFGQAYVKNPVGNMQIHSQLSDEEGVPVGTIEIPDDFWSFGEDARPIQNSILVYGRWALELGDIVPGQTITVTKTTPRRDLQDLLIPPQTLDNENLRRLATYNPQSADLEYIVRVMTLHRALGGYETTGLHHAYQPSLDMSDMLTTDRALLLGTVPTRTLSWVNTTKIFRTSLPITLTESSPRLGRERSEPGTGGVLDQQMRPAERVVDPRIGGGM